MQPTNFIRSGMDAKLAINEGNAQPSFSGSNEKKALKTAKATRLAFRKTKGYSVENFWSRLFKLLLKNNLT